MKRLSIAYACILTALLVAMPTVAQDDGDEQGGVEQQTEQKNEHSQATTAGHRHSGPFPMDLSVYGMLSLPAYYDFGVGAGVQFAYPLLAEGWIENPRYPDAFYIEGGLDFSWYRWDYGILGYNADINVLSFRPIVGVRYQVYFSDRWAAFGCVKGGLAFSSINWDDDYPGDADDIEVDFVLGFTPGLLWDINDDLSLRGEFNFGAYESFGVRIGILFKL